MRATIRFILKPKIEQNCKNLKSTYGIIPFISTKQGCMCSVGGWKAGEWLPETAERLGLVMTERGSEQMLVVC